MCPVCGILYRLLLRVVLGDLVYRLLVWCGAVGYVSGLRDSLNYFSENRTVCEIMLINMI
jgi:hypothetical protein